VDRLDELVVEPTDRSGSAIHRTPLGPGDRRVILAMGRDYNDVKPLSCLDYGSTTSRSSSRFR